MGKIAKISTYISAAFLVVMAVLTCVDVGGRYLFNHPLQGAFDLTELLLCAVAAFGIASATANDDHIMVDSIYQKLAPSGKRVLTIISAASGILVFAVLLWQGIVAVKDSMSPYYEKTMGTVPFVTFPFRILLVIGFFISIIAIIVRIYSAIRSTTPKSDQQD